MEKMKTVGLQFTEVQKEWLLREAKRLDRTVPWIVRNLVTAEMARQTPARRETPAKGHQRRVNLSH
jgi:hypothetical protein